MKARVYIETSIPSIYYTLRTDAESVVRMNWTRRWWSEFAEFTLVSSPAVVAELRRGTSETTGRRISLLKDVELLEITDEVDDVAKI